MPGFFQASYAEHREQFLRLAAARGARIETHRLEARGPADTPLTIDVAWCGAPEPAHVFLMLSAVHGVEGYAGSAIQAQFLAEDLEALPVPPDGAVVLVHAVNPFGFAWGRRVNENNVDLNRNFLDHAAHDIRRPDYLKHNDMINPTELGDDDDAFLIAQVQKIIEEVGFARTQEIVSQGQYEQPHGLSYGGAQEEAATRILRTLMRERLGGAADVHLMDFHTGLGESGRYTMLSDHEPDSPEHARMLATYPEGRVECPLAGGSISAALEGESGAGLAAEVPQVFFWGGAPEFGTVDALHVFRALRRENWCWHYGHREGPEREPFAQDLLDAFRPDSAQWRADVLAGGREVIQAGWTGVFGAG